MNPVIRIDEEVMNKLKERAMEYNMVFSTPNDVLKVILNLTDVNDSQPKSSEIPIQVNKVALESPKSSNLKVQKLIDGLLPMLSHLSNDVLKYHEKSGRWIAYPDNYIAIRVQDSRTKNLAITVRGNLSNFDDFRYKLDIKPDRPGYSRFNIDKEDQIPVAIRMIKHAHDL